MCKGVGTDNVTFTSLLSGCSHAGLLDEGLQYFESMGFVYNKSPTVEHYACMVDLLGRAGFLNEAEGLITTMLVNPVFLCGRPCSVLAEFMVMWIWEYTLQDKFLEVDSANDGGYVLLSNIYSAAGE
jgi:pentatricopeptide repeat protein